MCDALVGSWFMFEVCVCDCVNVYNVFVVVVVRMNKGGLLLLCVCVFSFIFHRFLMFISTNNQLVRHSVGSQ